MPPTRAAARKMPSGLFAAIHSSVSFWRVRSTVLRSAVRTSHFSDARRRTIAEPTMPRWPATQMRLPARSNRRASVAVVAAINVFLPLHLGEIGIHHLRHQLLEAGLVLPAELGVRLGGIAQQEINFGRAEIALVDLDDDLAGLLIHALFLDALALPGDLA